MTSSFRTGETPLESMAPLHHKTWLLDIDFDHQGLILWPRFTPSTRITWSEIEYVCPIPTMHKVGQEWREKPNHYLDESFRSTWQTSRLLHVCVVIRDRRPLLESSPGWWTRSWLSGMLKPMLDAEENRCPDQSLLELQLWQANLSCPVGQLMDLFTKYCRFDLVVF
jgi:hypothetical protein